MSNAWSVKWVSMVLLFCVALLFTNSGLASEECRVVNITSGSGLAWEVARLQPNIVNIAKGGCVLWFNRTRMGDLKIRLRDEKNCENYIEALSGFALDPESGCYGADRLAAGKSASLEFNASGVYEYVVEYGTAPIRRLYGKVGVTD